MRYVVKELDNTISPVSGDTVVLVVKDLQEKIFSAEYLKKMLDLEAEGIKVSLTAAPDMETFMFLAGVYSQNGQTTYKGFEFTPPESFSENIIFAPFEKTVSIAKKKSPRKRSVKAKDVSEAQAVKAGTDSLETARKTDREKAPAEERKESNKKDSDDKPDPDAETPVKHKMPPGLVPHETDDEVLKSLSGSDLAAYKILHIKSEDVEFTWPTSILMWQVLHNLEKCSDEEDAREALLSMRNGKKIAKVAEGHWDELLKIAKHEE